MNYEVVELAEKTVVGVSARTNNQDPKMGEIIGGLWTKLYQEEIGERINEKVNEKAIGLYTDYAGDENGEYTAFAGNEVKAGTKGPDGTETIIIPAGKYAKFVVEGDMHQAVADFWQKLWGMDLPRAFTYDFEEYQDDNMEETTIIMYIALKEE